MPNGKAFKQKRNIAIKKAKYQKRINDEIELIRSLDNDRICQVKDHNGNLLMYGAWLSGKQWKVLFKLENKEK